LLTISVTSGPEVAKTLSDLARQDGLIIEQPDLDALLPS
jgi:hypothetical protein